MSGPGDELANAIKALVISTKNSTEDQACSSWNKLIQAEILLTLGMYEDSLAIINSIPEQNETELVNKIKILRINLNLQLNQIELAKQTAKGLLEN